MEWCCMRYGCKMLRKNEQRSVHYEKMQGKNRPAYVGGPPDRGDVYADWL